jgi:plastocyanin
MLKLLAVPCSCLVLAIGAAGCGGDDEDDSSGSGGGGAETAQQDTGTAAAGVTRVSLKGIAFNPKALTVSKGTTVEWKNDEDVNHDVTKTGGAGPDFKSGASGGMAQGATFKHTFDTPGKIEYVCTVHPNMTAEVTVR